MSTNTAIIYVSNTTVTQGGDPFYNLSLNPFQSSSYGDYSDSNTTFTCADAGCQFTVVNAGYSNLWQAIMNVSNYDGFSVYVAPPHTKIDGLTNGTNVETLPSISQNIVEWQNESARYKWALFDSEDATLPIATSEFFQLRISGWNYSSGLPEASTDSTGSTGSQASRKSSLSGGAIAGIVVGVLSILIVALIAFFIVRRRRRRGGAKSIRNPPNVHEKGVDNPSGKPELVGSPATKTGIPYNKPELAAISKPLSSDISSSQGTSLPHGGGTGSSRETNLPYDGGAGAPTESDEVEDKQLTESERLIPNHMEAQEPQPGLLSEWKQNINASNAMSRPRTHENLNVLKAQERELAHKMEVTEELQRMRAEHAALVERIRIAEMREREVRGGS